MAGKNELVALSTVKEFNNLVKRAASAASDHLSTIWKAGETAKKAKESIPHGGWLAFVEQHYDVSHDTVSRWVKFHETVPESKLRNVRNLTAGMKMLDPPKNDTKTRGGPSGSASGSTGAGTSDAARNQPAAPPDSDPPWEEPEGQCPNCLGNKWDTLDDGTYCARCNHPYGEPAGDVDEDRIKTQRQKTVKTIEALMRAFDDLQLLLPNDLHEYSITTCKALLEAAKEWK